MRESAIISRSVTQLLEQSTAATDVPDPSVFVDQHWLRPVRVAAATLIGQAQDAEFASRSFRGNGQEVLLLARDDASDVFIYLRRHIAGETQPITAAEKTVVMTLNGSVSMEAFRDSADVEADEPWYVRDFDSESIYACHPGTVHRLDLSADGVQLVLSREALSVIEGAKPLLESEYEAAISAARTQLLEISQQPLRLMDATS
ncbi:hypothetical protein [Nonomuraea sp. NPDC049129]|uniref:hypothetical protein n=1 Tax=Nonomuraea sp. NPDC049129 TaxID=3155272 RepID=UPI0033E1A211